MCSQRGLARLQLDYEIYTDIAITLADEIADLTFKHSRLKTIKADTYELAQEIRALGLTQARAEGKAMQIQKVIEVNCHEKPNFNR